MKFLTLIEKTFDHSFRIFDKALIWKDYSKSDVTYWGLRDLELTSQQRSHKGLIVKSSETYE